MENSEFKTLKNKVIQHLDNEMNLGKQLKTLTSKQHQILQKVIFTHPHTKQALIISNKHFSEIKEKIKKFKKK